MFNAKQALGLFVPCVVIWLGVVFFCFFFKQFNQEQHSCIHSWSLVLRKTWPSYSERQLWVHQDLGKERYPRGLRKALVCSICPAATSYVRA